MTPAAAQQQHPPGLNPTAAALCNSLKIESEATERGALGQDQVSTEMGFDTVTSRGGEGKKKKEKPLGGNESPPVDAAVDSESIME